MNIKEFMNNIGFHDNWILNIEIENNNVKIYIDDLDANLIKDETDFRPGYIEVKNCSVINWENLVDYWMVSGHISEENNLVTLKLMMNNGSKLLFSGQEINVIYHNKYLAQQVDAPEPASPAR